MNEPLSPDRVRALRKAIQADAAAEAAEAYEAERRAAAEAAIGQAADAIRAAEVERVWRAVEEADRIGREAGANAAAWFIQETIGGRAEAEAVLPTARKLVAGIEDGDPEVSDVLPAPNLSGQEADTLTGPGLLETVYEAAGGAFSEDYDTDVFEAYEAAFTKASEDAITKAARETIEAAAEAEVASDPLRIYPADRDRIRLLAGYPSGPWGDPGLQGLSIEAETDYEPGGFPPEAEMVAAIFRAAVETASYEVETDDPDRPGYVLGGRAAAASPNVRRIAAARTAGAIRETFGYPTIPADLLDSLA